MNTMLIKLIVVFLFPLSGSSSLDIISIENPFKNSRHCEKVEVKRGYLYDPLMDHLLEDGCKHPVRQSQLEEDFDEVINKNHTNVQQRIELIAEKEIIDWQNFKHKYLEIPSEYSEFDGYSFIEDVHPMCSRNEILMLRICFSLNPTRAFGRPQMFITSDGTLYQIAIGDRYLSSSTCSISGMFGRCTARLTSIVFEFRKELKKSSITSPIYGNNSWTSFGMVGAVLFAVSLFSVMVFWYYRRRKNELKKQRNNISHSKKPSIHILNTSKHIGIPFIDDDSLMFDI